VYVEKIDMRAKKMGEVFFRFFSFRAFFFSSGGFASAVVVLERGFSSPDLSGCASWSARESYTPNKAPLINNQLTSTPLPPNNKQTKYPTTTKTKTKTKNEKTARKAGALGIFVVDASGSMALNRMAAAKGACMRLLAESYTSRDQVRLFLFVICFCFLSRPFRPSLLTNTKNAARRHPPKKQVCLIPFYGDRAEVLLPPSKSIAMARRRLDSLPCGGGSPLAHAVSLAARTGLAAQQGGDVGRVMTVLITDGRANVALAKSNDDPALLEEGAVKLGAEELKDEVRDMARKLAASG
jgi:Mg-chelatase subunit ChlD